MSVLCYSLFSPDNKQQKVTESLLVALQFLQKSPEGWGVEEFFDGTVSRGIVATRNETPGFDVAIARVIDLLEREAKGDAGLEIEIRNARMGLGHSTRIYAEKCEQAALLGRLKDANAIERLLSFVQKQARANGPDAVLWAQAAGMAESAQRQQTLLLNGVSGLYRSFITGDHYESKNPYSRPYVEQGMKAVQEVIGFHGDWKEVEMGLQNDRFVIRSESESVASDGEAGFWSNEDGWGAPDAATQFSRDEIADTRLPLAAQGDASWVSVATIERQLGRKLGEKTPAPRG